MRSARWLAICLSALVVAAVVAYAQWYPKAYERNHTAYLAWVAGSNPSFADADAFLSKTFRPGTPYEAVVSDLKGRFIFHQHSGPPESGSPSTLSIGFPTSVCSDQRDFDTGRCGGEILVMVAT